MHLRRAASKLGDLPPGVKVVVLVLHFADPMPTPDKPHVPPGGLKLRPPELLHSAGRVGGGGRAAGPLL